TFFYRMNEMIGLNEVGCHALPHLGGVEAFHDEMRAFSRRAPSLLATSTHDTKFGEDSRALLLTLAERPEEWAQCFRRWQEMNPPHGDLPEPEVEWQLYQALAAIWPHDASWQNPRNLE